MAALHDPLTGETEGILRRCLYTDTCPKVFNIDSANEYWNKSSSLNHTDAFGQDLAIDDLAPNARQYFVASIQQYRVRLGSEAAAVLLAARQSPLPRSGIPRLGGCARPMGGIWPRAAEIGGAAHPQRHPRSAAGGPISSGSGARLCRLVAAPGWRVQPESHECERADGLLEGPARARWSEPEQIRVMHRAFEAVCAALELSIGLGDHVTELVGEKIIELTVAGERDADRLTARVLAEFGIENDGSLWRH
jgi:hypothetical protein